MTDLVQAVLDSADAHPHEPALTVAGTTLTYGELGARIRSTAAALRAHGMSPGDRVLFSVRPGADAVVLALGIVLARGTVVFADPGAGEALFRSRTRLASPRWVAAESVLYLASSAPLRGIARRRGLELAPYARLVPDATHIRAGRWLPGVPRRALSLDALAHHPTPSTPHATTPSPDHEDDEALIVFTSGTTAAPKGVVHSRGSLGAGLSDFADGVGIRRGHRVLTDQLMVGVPALIAGAHWSMPPVGANPGARPDDYLALLPDTELLFAAPAAMDAILRAIDARPTLAPPHLDTIVLGGAPVLRPLLERIHRRFPTSRIRAIYGMTEILPVAIADGVAKLEAGVAPDGGDAVGRIVGSVTARIDDGELVLAGPGLARGYLADLPEHPLTELRTGDLARIDDGALTLRGRKKDMFIRGTQNVYPGLYEPIIAGLPGVDDVVLSGVPDEIGDDRIVLVLVPADDPPTGLTETHPLVASVRSALPGLIDAGVIPDLILTTGALPRSGRARKLDRRALAGQLAAHFREYL
ncbi:class I adenylate-forming enzyme family protein [Microbacterium sp. NPDC055903]